MRDRASLEAFQRNVIRYLVSPIVANGDGRVYSWVNPDRPGFVYPEAMGLYLRLISTLAASRQDDVLARRAHEVARGLHDLMPPEGGVGMDGNSYLFDTCMAVGGLVAYRRLLGGAVEPDLLERMGRFIVDLVERRLALVDPSGAAPQVRHHWSTIFGAHMLKTVIALDLLAEETGEGRCRSLAYEVADEVLAGCLKEGAFRIGPADEVVYCHAHCYALEGLLYLRARGQRDTTAVLKAGAEKLREWQSESGGMFNWYLDPSRERAKVGDATAQSVRIWIAVDRDAYAPNIERGLAFLHGLASPAAGIYYALGSRDVNSITSVFATQALEWYLQGPRPEWLV